MQNASIHIGTSGWSYPDWHEFFHADLKSADHLQAYAQQFSTGEYNRSFYNLTRESTLEKFTTQVPDSFIFSVKANKRVTHLEKLTSDANTIASVVNRFAILGPHLGAILFQLPPSLGRDDNLLNEFIKKLPNGFRYTIEFRNPSWHCDSVYEILKANNIAFCIYDLAKNKSPFMITADFIYIRLHGETEPYRGRYQSETLNYWASKIQEHRSKLQHIYCYFDNSIGGGAPLDALQLIQMLQLDL